MQLQALFFNLSSVTLLNECCHMRLSPLGLDLASCYAAKPLHTHVCGFRNWSFQQLQGPGSRAKVFYISAALMTYLRMQWASHTKWWKGTKSCEILLCCAVLLAGCVCYSKLVGQKGVNDTDQDVSGFFFFFYPLINFWKSGDKWRQWT